VLTRPTERIPPLLPSLRALATAGGVVVAAAMLVLASSRVVAPLFDNVSLQGIHDWDSSAAMRYITVLSLKTFHELPWYNPYLCGGFPAWPYSDATPNLVSIFLPFYLTMPILTALRAEILGNLVISLLGAYAVAARYTTSIALRALVATMYTLNGRWALQTATGHAWHLQYALAPVALFFFDVACDRGRSKWALGGGIAIAMMVYQGGLYPVPHTALLLGCMAFLKAVLDRSARPLIALSIAGASAIGLSGPKLLPMIELMTRYPRIIESNEVIGIDQLTAMLTSPAQSVRQGAAPVPAYGWHEWGMYIGWPMLLAMGLALMFARRARDNAARIVGLLFFVLSLGAFSKYAPWTILHKVPVFASQHVPSRFMYLGFLPLTLAFAGWFGGVLEHPIARRLLLHILVWIPVWYCVMDVASVSRITMEQAFGLKMPAVAWHPVFKHVVWPAYNYEPRGAWAGPSLPAMMSNEGFLGCYSVPDRAEPHGAVATSAPGYRGEVHFEDDSGTATIVHWSPNRAEVEYAGATPGAILVYNMNYDPNWRADGRPSFEHQHAVATRVTASRGTVEFRYFPRMLPWGLLFFGTTVALALWGGRLLRFWQIAIRRASHIVQSFGREGATKAQPQMPVC